MRTASSLLDELDVVRRRHVRAGTWPEHSLEVWRQVYDEAILQTIAGRSLTRAQRHALELFVDGR